MIMKWNLVRVLDEGYSEETRLKVFRDKRDGSVLATISEGKGIYKWRVELYNPRSPFIEAKVFETYEEAYDLCQRMIRLFKD